MNIEIISIGDELLIGQTVNTNASWIGAELLKSGRTVRWVTTVGDHRHDLTGALETALSRADVVLLTGGLGPTHDDITKAVVAELFGVTCSLDQAILEQIKQRFRRRGIPMARVNEEQARVPQGAEVLSNDQGTAPGFLFRRDGVRIYVMPGVPREMKSMMQRLVLPELVKDRDGGFNMKMLCTTGIPESTLYEKIGDLGQLDPAVRIAFLPSLAGVRLRISANADTDRDAEERVSSAADWLRRKIESFIYAEEDISLAEAVGRILKERGMKLAVAESCTGGWIAHQLTNIPGSSAFFERGIISYSNASKIELLGVPAGLVERYGAVSEPVARAMAEGVRRLARADAGLSTTGIAGPAGGTVSKPVGRVYVGYADAGESAVREHHYANDRLGNKERFAQAALNLLRLKLQENSGHGG